MEESPAPTTTPATPAGVPPPSALLTAGVVLVAANMRPVATSIGPLVHQIRGAQHISGAVAGLLGTIPVLCFGAVAPVALLLRRRLGMARTVGLLLGAICAGLLLRVSGSTVALFAGTTVAAAGVACGNVLLPVIVTRSFSQRIGTISMLYTTALVGMAALAAGLTVPIANALGAGWRGGLAVWAAPAVLAFVVWLPQLRRDPPGRAADTRRASLRAVTRDPLAWQLTLFFALQSWSFYTAITWLPSILESHGVSSTSAGAVLGLMAVMGVPGALLMPKLATRLPDQRWLAVALTAVTALGLAGLLVSPTSVPVVWALLLGLGPGSCFPLALTMIVLRGGAPHTTAGLSTHVQGAGYLISALGPLTCGALHDATRSWTASLVLLLALLVPQALSGLGAGRSRLIRAAAGQG